MNRICAALIGLLLASAAQAQQVVNPTPNAGAYGAYNAVAPTCVTGTGCWLQTDINGQLKITGTVTVTPSGTQNVNLTQILSAPPSLTNPLWVFPATGATFPISGTVTANQGTAGSAWPVTLTSTTITGNVSVVGTTSNAGSAVATSSTNVPAIAYTYGFNGTTWDQLLVDSNKNLLTSSGGAPSLATAQVSVTTGNISVAAARTGRRAVTITNVTGTSAIYCGNTGVATTTGTYLGGTAGSNITLNTTAAIFCTVAATIQTVTVVETF